LAEHGGVEKLEELLLDYLGKPDVLEEKVFESCGPMSGMVTSVGYNWVVSI